MKLRLAGWETWSAAAAGLVAAILMPNDFYNSAVSEIVTVLGFLMAAFVPAMVLAATALRAGGFSVKRIRELGAGIRRQINVFGGLFLYALAACGVLIAGKLVSWTVPALFGSYVPRSGAYLSSAFPGVITFLLIFLSLRSFAFVVGIGSLLNLTVSIAEDEARGRDGQADARTGDELASYKMPASYGTELSK